MSFFKNNRIVLGVGFLMLMFSTAILSRVVGTKVSQPQATVQQPAQPKIRIQIRESAQQVRTEPLAKSHERFTQTEAYLQSSELREKVTKTFTGDRQVVRHMDVVSRVMAKEALFRDTHWAFYHGANSSWTVSQDLYTKLYRHFNPSAKASAGKFIFLRFGDYGDKTVKQFLTEGLRRHGLIDDNNEDKGLLLSANVSLFGNTGNGDECTWRFFMADRSRIEPQRKIYEKIMDEFKLPYTFVEQLMQLEKMLESKHETLLQILIPKDRVDDVAYLSWVAGVPGYSEAISWVRNNVKKKVYKAHGGKPAELWALASLKSKFKKEQEKNKMFKEMLEGIEKGDYSINDFLKKYCNEPQNVRGLNYAQARLLFTNSLLLNPASGAMIFRHTTVPGAKVEEYEKKLDGIIQQILAAKK